MLTHRRLPTPPCLMRSRIALIRGARDSPGVVPTALVEVVILRDNNSR